MCYHFPPFLDKPPPPFQFYCVGRWAVRWAKLDGSTWTGTECIGGRVQHQWLKKEGVLGYHLLTRRTTAALLRGAEVRTKPKVAAQCMRIEGPKRRHIDYITFGVLGLLNVRM